ncbi:MAG: phenylalanine--tRNA ligase subunit beta [Leptospirillia bacterium]
MPTLEGHLDDLNSLLPAPLSPEEMNHVLDRVKGEWKYYDPTTRRFKIELNDTNRPDLWSVEGIARQLRGGTPLPGRPYDFLERAAKRKRETPAEIVVDPGLSAVRPFLGGFRATGGTLGEEGLEGLIGTQERLSELFGRKRADLAIGVYPLKGATEISFPLSFRLADPDTTQFVPLGEESPRSLREVVSTHPKGIAYGPLISSFPAWPVLSDARGEILSLPPVINSQMSGAVVAGDRDLFVEATGNDPQRILLALNILAANLTDRGFHVDPLLSKGKGWDLLAPGDPEIKVFVPAGLPARVLGCGKDPQDFIEVLLGFGYPALSWKGKETNGEGDPSGEGFEVLQPFYRDDLLGAVDVVEDYLVARGFSSFTPVMPRAFTAGSSAPRIKVENRIRTAFLGMGFTELLSNILTGEPTVTTRLGRPGDSLVRIDNPASLQYAVVRPTLLSGLLAAESRSARHPYPHRLFEVGEAMELSHLSSGEPRLKDLHLAAALVSHPQAGISELQGVLDALLARFFRGLVLEATDLPPYIPGRCGVLKNSRGERIATVGEIHPATLDLWGIRMPTAAFEIDLGALLEKGACADPPHS